MRTKIAKPRKSARSSYDGPSGSSSQASHGPSRARSAFYADRPAVTLGRAPAVQRRSAGETEASETKAGAVTGSMRMGKEGDAWEREADQVADAVAGGGSAPLTVGGAPALQKKCASCEAEEAASGAPSIQMLSETSEENDSTEAEATATDTPSLQKKCANCDEEQSAGQAPDIQKQDQEASGDDEAPDLQMAPAPATASKAASAAPAGSPGGAAIRHPGPGRGLSKATRAPIESALGSHLGHVRIHDTAKDRALADSLNARAFTHRNHIWLGSGASAADQRLLAHEATHVVQQTEHRSRAPALQREPEEASAAEKDPGAVATKATTPPTVVPCSPPVQIFHRGRCASGDDFRFLDFPSLAGVSRAKQLAVAEARLNFDFQLRNRMRTELGILAGSEGFRVVSHFASGSGSTLTHDLSSLLGMLAFFSGSFLRLNRAVVRAVDAEIQAQASAGSINCGRLSLPASAVPPISFSLSDGPPLKGIIGGTQGLTIFLTNLTVDPVARTFYYELRYDICDDFGVDTSDLYSPALIAFWVLQHERSGHRPFINRLDLPTARRGGRF